MNNTPETNAELIATARAWLQGYLNPLDATLIRQLTDALEADEAEPRYTIIEAAALIADKLEEQGAYSAAGYLRDDIRAAS